MIVGAMRPIYKRVEKVGAEESTRAPGKSLGLIPLALNNSKIVVLRKKEANDVDSMKGFLGERLRLHKRDNHY